MDRRRRQDSEDAPCPDIDDLIFGDAEAAPSDR